MLEPGGAGVVEGHRAEGLVDGLERRENLQDGGKLFGEREEGFALLFDGGCLGDLSECGVQRFELFHPEHVGIAVEQFHLNGLEFGLHGLGGGCCFARFVARQRGVDAEVGLHGSIELLSECIGHLDGFGLHGFHAQPHLFLEGF